MSIDTFKNFAIGTLSTGINNSATSISLTSGHGARFPTTPFNATIWNSTDYTSPADAYLAGHAEIVRVKSRSTDTLTVTRAHESTSAVNLNTGGKTYSIAQTMSAQFTKAVTSLTGFGGPAAAQYFMFEGDSLTATDTTGDEQPDWNTRVMLLDQFAGRGTRLNLAENGGVITDIAGRYTTYAYPYRPGQNGVEQAWIFLWIGTNDAITASISEVTTVYNTWKSSWDSYMTTARADGFKLVAFTITGRDYSTDPGDGEDGFEMVRTLMNDYIRGAGRGKYDVLIDVAQWMPDNTDQTFFMGDNLHMRSGGRQYVADIVNAQMRAGGTLPFPPYNNSGVVIGTGASEVPSNNLLTTTARAFTAAQGHAESTIADASTFDWDLDADPVLRLPEIGANKTINAPTNMRAGFRYRITLPFNATGGYTITWNDVFKGLSSLTTTGYWENVIWFDCDGTHMVAVAQKAFDATPPAEPGAGELVHDSFTDVGGTGRTLRGFAPDTLNTPGNNWLQGRGDDWQSPNIGSGNPGYVTNSQPSVSTVYDLEESDAYVETLMRFTGSNLPDGRAGLVPRYVDTNNYWLFGFNQGGSWTIYKVVSGSFTTVQTGSITYNDTDGHVLRVEMSGNALVFKIDGTTVHTVSSDSTHATATKHGIGDVSHGGSLARWFWFKAGT